MRDPVRRQARTLALACCLALCSTQAGAVPEAVPSAGAQQKPDPLFDQDFDELGGDAAVADPIEPFNRVIFGVNEAVDFILWTPATRIYRFAVPRPARAGIRRVFLNLNSTSVLINKILQLRLGDAAKTLGRFLLNTTAGWGGLFDPAAAVGWEPQHADFGETLASMRVPPGPYLVLPFFGPSSIRDGVGTIVDQFLQPTLYFLGPVSHIFVGTGFGFTLRDEKADEIRLLKESSVDYYSVLRSAYWQNREASLDRSLGREADAD